MGGGGGSKEKTTKWDIGGGGDSKIAILGMTYFLHGPYEDDLFYQLSYNRVEALAIDFSDKRLW